MGGGGILPLFFSCPYSLWISFVRLRSLVGQIGLGTFLCNGPLHCRKVEKRSRTYDCMRVHGCNQGIAHTHTHTPAPWGCLRGSCPSSCDYTVRCVCVLHRGVRVLPAAPSSSALGLLRLGWHRKPSIPGLLAGCGVRWASPKLMGFAPSRHQRRRPLSRSQLSSVGDVLATDRGPRRSNRSGDAASFGRTNGLATTMSPMIVHRTRPCAGHSAPMLPVLDQMRWRDHCSLPQRTRRWRTRDYIAQHRPGKRTGRRRFALRTAPLLVREM